MRRFGCPALVLVSSAWPIDRLTAGEYLLEIAASAGDDTAARKLRFTIR
jgi:hypothetical protein